MSDKCVQMQAQIRENAMIYSDYIKDLSNWEKEIRKKDVTLKKKNKIISQSQKEELRAAPEQKVQEAQKQSETGTKTTYKRDMSKMQDYYKAWDNIDIDKEIEKVDQGLNKVTENATIINNDKLKVEGREMYAKTGAAQPCSKITVKGGRNKPPTPVEEFKIEGNRAMASFDYERAVSLYTQGIQLKPEGDLLMTLYTNRAQAYLSLKKYQNAESDATNALEVNPNHVKSLHRLSQAKYYLYKLKEAENLLLKILSLEKSAECDEYLKTVRKEMEKKRLEVIDKMVSGGKYYNGNSNAVSILEIDS